MTRSFKRLGRTLVIVLVVLALLGCGTLSHRSRTSKFVAPCKGPQRPINPEQLDPPKPAHDRGPQ
jgi:hypothetical protein